MVQTLVQYSNQARVWTANARFAWLSTAGTGLFVVFNEGQEADGFFRWNRPQARSLIDRKSTRLNSSHGYISYAVFCLKKKKKKKTANAHIITKIDTRRHK